MKTIFKLLPLCMVAIALVVLSSCSQAKPDINKIKELTKVENPTSSQVDDMISQLDLISNMSADELNKMNEDDQMAIADLIFGMTLMTDSESSDVQISETQSKKIKKALSLIDENHSKGKQELTPYTGRNAKGVITQYFNLPDEPIELTVNNDGSRTIGVEIERNYENIEETQALANTPEAEDFIIDFHLNLFDENNKSVAFANNEDQTIASLFSLQPGESIIVVFEFNSDKKNQENLLKAKTYLITAPAVFQ